MAILETVKREADIVVFPEFSIPFDYLEEIQKYADENGIIVVAGSTMLRKRILENTRNYLLREFAEEDFTKEYLSYCNSVFKNNA